MQNSKIFRYNGICENDFRKRAFLTGLILIFFKTKVVIIKENERNCGLVSLVFLYFDLRS